MHLKDLGVRRSSTNKEGARGVSVSGLERVVRELWCCFLLVGFYGSVMNVSGLLILGMHLFVPLQFRGRK